jgi:hypothetical protein
MFDGQPLSGRRLASFNHPNRLMTAHLEPVDAQRTRVLPRQGALCMPNDEMIIEDIRAALDRDSRNRHPAEVAVSEQTGDSDAARQPQ